MLNTLTTMSRLTADPVVRESQAGKSYTTFSVACNNKFGGEETTVYYDVTAFGKTGELAAGLLKGQLIVLEGTPSLNTYQKKDGSTGASIQIVLNRMSYVPGQKGEGTPQTSGGQAQQSKGSDFSPIGSGVPQEVY